MMRKTICRFIRWAADIQTIRVWHPESPGVHVIVNRSRLGRLFKSPAFATLSEVLEEKVYKISGAMYRVGMRVIDEDGNIGTLISVDDPHNVDITYDRGGTRLICVVCGCPMVENLKILYKDECHV